MFASDGMRPDLMERYADKGIMPTYKDLMKRGVRGKNGLLQGFPPNTGVGWHTLATGTWPGEHGSTNNTFHRTGAASTPRRASRRTGSSRRTRSSSRPSGPGRRSSRWSGSPPARSGPSSRGRSIDFRTFIGGRGITLNFDLPGQPALAQSFGVQYQRHDARRRARLDERPGLVQPGQADDLHATTTGPR